jgi:hypothetical protein
VDVGFAGFWVLTVFESEPETAVSGLDRPGGAWMSQIARNLTDAEEGFLNGSRHLIHDRDPLFTRSFRRVLESSGVKTVKLPARSPILNAYAEPFVRSIESECLAQIIPLGPVRCLLA